VSHQVRTLEAQLGFSLFARTGRVSRLTAEGQQLLEVVREHFTPIEDALAGIRHDRAAVRGTVNLAGPMPFARDWLRPRLVRLMRQYPDLVLNVRFGLPSALTLGVLEGTLDFAILSETPDSPLLAHETLFVEAFIAVCSPSYWGEASLTPTAKQLAAHRFIVFSEALPMHAVWWRANFGNAPLPTNIACRIANIDEILYFVEQGMGVAVLPNYIVADSVAEGRLRQLDAPGGRAGRFGAPRNALNLVWRKGRVDSARVKVVRSALLAAEAPAG
jgi:DNA-binding transcriptional LysR family regulator